MLHPASTGLRVSEPVDHLDADVEADGGAIGEDPEGRDEQVGDELDAAADRVGEAGAEADDRTVQREVAEGEAERQGEITAAGDADAVFDLEVEEEVARAAVLAA